MPDPLLEPEATEAETENEERGPAGPPPPRHRPEQAPEDLAIKRPDLGPNTYTQVRRGDRIPPGLAEYPRRPLAEARKPRRARRKAPGRKPAARP